MRRNMTPAVLTNTQYSRREAQRTREKALPCQDSAVRSGGTQSQRKTAVMRRSGDRVFHTKGFEFARRHAVIHDHPYPLPTVSTHPDPGKFTRCNLELASGKQVPGYVSTVWWPPVRLYGDLCTERMNVHLVLHLHILSGSMSLSTLLTP